MNSRCGTRGCSWSTGICPAVVSGSMEPSVNLVAHSGSKHCLHCSVTKMEVLDRGLLYKLDMDCFPSGKLRLSYTTVIAEW